MVDESGHPSARRMTPSLEAALGGAPVCVGTENLAKCGAVRQALEKLQSEEAAAEIQILPIAVESDVAEQPVGFEEISRGARNRARAAFASGRGGLAIGIEDGLVELAGAGIGNPKDSSLTEASCPGSVWVQHVFNIGCAWITDGEREGSGFSSAFAYPIECRAPAFEGCSPIGDLFDELWCDRRDRSAEGISGRNEGNIGRLTAGQLTRSEYGSHAVLCALIRFLQQDLYD
jgi:inosine/xanthosine triphosphatase